MDKFDLLEAMSGIRDEYIAAAADATQPNALQEKQDQAAKEGPVSGRRRPGRAGILRMQRWAAAAAALLCLSVVVPNVSPGAASAFRDLPLFGQYFRAVTFRSYEYQDERSDAYVEETQIITMAAGDAQEEAASAAGPEETEKQEEAVLAAGPEETEKQEEAAENGALEEPAALAFAREGKSAEMDSGADAAASDAGAAGAPAAKTGGLQIAETMEPSAADTEESAEEADTSDSDILEDESAGSGDVSVQAALSAAKITQEIRAIAEEKIAGFEKSIAEETGYHGLRFLHETVTDTGKWFCLSVLTYTSAADGFEQMTHFTIDKEAGTQTELADLFEEDTDYVTPISEYIKEQMRAQMAEDPDIEYMIDTEEDPEFDFQEISASQDFYINEDGGLVICFDELEVAPMYMGTVEFVIPDSVIAGIRKK